MNEGLLTDANRDEQSDLFVKRSVALFVMVKMMYILSYIINCLNLLFIKIIE